MGLGRVNKSYNIKPLVWASALAAAQVPIEYLSFVVSYPDAIQSFPVSLRGRVS